METRALKFLYFSEILFSAVKKVSFFLTLIFTQSDTVAWKFDFFFEMYFEYFHKTKS